MIGEFSMLDIEKSTLAVAASVAAGCRTCVDFHLGALARAGGGQSEREAAIAAAVRGLRAFEVGLVAHARGTSVPIADDAETVDLATALLDLVVALATTDSVYTKSRLARAKASGAGAADLAIVRGVAAKIRERAAHHAEEVMDEDCPATEAEAPGRGCACGCG